MINLRFGIPLFFLVLHQHVANSAFGLNNPRAPLTVFFLFISAMCMFIIANKNLGYSKFVAVLLLLLFLVLWLLNPILFKDISSLYFNLFITFYIISQRGFLAIKNQLSFIVFASALLSFFQIWGLSPIFHEWNSQFLDERAGYIVRNIEVHNIIENNLKSVYEYDSRQVRAPGIFHSSALVSGIFVMYIAFIFIGIYRSLKNYIFIPFICVLSGSKLVVIATILFCVLTIISLRLSLKKILILMISSILAVLLHKYMFNSLMNFQFNVDILLYSFDVRSEGYAFELFDLNLIDQITNLILYLVIGLFLTRYILKFSINTDKIFVYTILIIAVSSSFFATPHIANFLFGWFYLPAFFVVQNFTKKNRRAKDRDDLVKISSLGLSV